ncbi:MAG: TolC family protein [Acidobacteria bacterium]|nr:TolC family protein [Acidobacteriota bacterium]
MALILPAVAAGQPAAIPVLPLDRCIAIALEKNHRRPASKFAVAIAEAQHRQALAAYWPQVDAKGGYTRLDEPLNFLFPATMMQIPAQSIAVPGGSALVTIPANAFGPGFPPANIQLPVAFPGQTVDTAAQVFPIPEQNIKVLGRDMVSGAMNMNWLLFDGGMRKGWKEQASAGVAAMREEVRRTDLEIVDTVKRYYWGSVLARQLHQVAGDTLERMEATLNLTQSMYQGGSGKVTKADYLDNQVMVETLRSMVAQVEKNEIMAQAALANTMGLAWNASVRPADPEITVQPFTGTMEGLAGLSYQFSPDWKKLEAGIRAAEGSLTTARSGYYPKIGLSGELHRWWNNGFSSGASSAANRTGWSAGIGLEIPVFNGFLTAGRISEARARLEQLKQTQFLLKEGLGLQVRDLVCGLEAALKSYQATARALKSSEENRELNTRAYQNELVDTEKVIRAQLMEALMSAQHLKARYDCVSLVSQLSLVVGREINDKLSPGR